MHNFDYECAWLNLAKPAFECLPANLRDLLEEVKENCAHLNQQSDLNVPWPSISFKNKFEKIPLEYLSLASKVIFYYGHWGNRHCFQEQGVYWKFSNYCDQILKAVVIPYVNRKFVINNDLNFKITNGGLYLVYKSIDFFHKLELGIATLNFADNLFSSLGQIDNNKKFYNKCISYTNDTNNLKCRSGGFKSFANFLDLSSYYL